jgi:prepilin-type N-terminal cleavage/methylation domain-containing protein
MIRNNPISLARRFHPDRGFTLIEALAAMMVITIITAMVMQLLIFVAALKAQSEQYNQSMNWIQADLETIRYQAREYEQNVSPYSAKCKSTTVGDGLATTAADGLAAGFLNDATAGLGGTPKVLGPKFLGGENLILTRTAVYATSAEPFKLLQLNYTVTPQIGGSAIASLETEVVLNAAFKCP